MDNMKIAIIGLGYVGLPLAHAFSFKYEVIGFDINNNRINALKNTVDETLELSSKQLEEAINNNIKFSNVVSDITDSNVYIITVPTPIDKYNKPNLIPLLKASEMVAAVLKKDDIVIYESTVYPGATEEYCVPILEKISNLTFNQDFYCGYSPERINPGDKKHTVTKILKITSGSTPEIAKKVDKLYHSIITAGTYLAPNIKVAEAAKVIENSQRDINIAFVNELAQIFNKLDIDTNEVLKAAATKWNFLPFKPGLVGGHCIGVDPYYLTHKATAVGYHPEIILAGRKLNDNMGIYVANQVIKLLIKKSYKVSNAKILILGISFKENCPDIRNSKVISVIDELKDFGCLVDVYDPLANKDDVKREYGISLVEQSALNISNYNAIVLAVAHDIFKEFDVILQQENKGMLIYDIKNFFSKSDGRL